LVLDLNLVTECMGFGYTVHQDITVRYKVESTSVM